MINKRGFEVSQTMKDCWDSVKHAILGSKARSNGCNKWKATKKIRASFTATAAFLLPFMPAATESHGQVASTVERAQIVGTLILQGGLFHVQGIDFDKANIWVTSVDMLGHRGLLHKFDWTGRLVGQTDLTDGPWYQLRYHVGGISISKNSIWVPVAENMASSSTVIMEIDPTTMRIRRRLPIIWDHLGCVAVSDDGHLVAANWDSKKFYIIDPNTKEPMRVLDNPSTARYQDMKFIGSQLIAGGVVTSTSGIIDRIDFPSMKVVQTWRTGAIDADNSYPLTDEGMTLRGGHAYALPEANPMNLLSHTATMFEFKLDDGASPRLSKVSNGRAVTPAFS